MKPTKQLVHIHVARHIPQGLLVKLDDGSEGVIRVREISWEEMGTATWKKEYHIGWDGYAFPLPVKKGEAREFSLRIVEDDPWEDLVEGQFDKSKVFDGVVTGVYDYGVFIEIEPGLTGLLRKGRVPKNLQPSILDLFWHGDNVWVSIQDIDYEQRQIELSLAPENSGLFEGKSTESIEALHTIMPEDADTVKTNIPRQHILLVEDEDPQKEAVSRTLRELGQSVDSVADAEHALEFLSKSKPDLAIVDVGLPGKNGIELAQIILQDHPGIEVVIATDWVRANEMRSMLGEIQDRGAEFLIKPLSPDVLRNFLLTKQGQNIGATPQESQYFPSIQEISSRKNLRKLLGTCKKVMNADHVILFSLDTAHRKVSVIERIGDGGINKQGLAQLIHSPVRDVAEDGDQILANEIQKEDQKRFQYLLEFAPATMACIGVQVPSVSTKRYALFALDHRAKTYGKENMVFMQGMALALGASIDQSDLREKLALIQRAALTGNLAGGMIHEINNLAATLQLDSDDLQKKLQSPDKSLENIASEIAGVDKDIKHVVSTMGLFGKIAKTPQIETLRVDEAVKDVIFLLKHFCKKELIKMRMKQPDELVVIRTQTVMLEQILLNVALNAIQQIPRSRNRGEGKILIDLQVINAGSDGSMCKILISDNGPGIHTPLREKIFDMGFSTRQDGSGLGLFVSRNLMEEIGGKIYVAQSHILGGTTFALEFPGQL